MIYTSVIIFFKLSSTLKCPIKYFNNYFNYFNDPTKLINISNLYLTKFLDTATSFFL